MRPFYFSIIGYCLVCLAWCAPVWAQPIKDLYQQAEDAYNAKQFDRAVSLYQRIIEAAPHFAPAYNGMALAIKGLSGDEDQIIHYLKRAVQYDPRLSQAYENLGRVYYARQDFTEAQGYFEKALAIDPDLSGSQLSLAWIYLVAKSNPSKALEYFQQVIKVAPSPNAYFGLGLAYFADNQRSKVLEIITTLRGLGHEDLASQLEASLRENRRVNSEPSGSSSNDQHAGMKVRLRGKLSDY